eukprot:2805905-Prymnesium_polylepis.1
MGERVVGILWYGDAIGGDGNVCVRPRCHLHQRSRVAHEDGVGVARPHGEAKREQLAVEAHLEHAHLGVERWIGAHVGRTPLEERFGHLAAIDEDAVARRRREPLSLCRVPFGGFRRAAPQRVVRRRGSII